MTALITTQVRATYSYPNGSPVVGAKVVANLSRYENDNGLVVPTSITSLTDENGSATLSLWPNSRGVGGSTYAIYISKDNKTIWSGTVVVPELNTIVDVHTILQTTASPSLDAAQIAVLQAQEYAAQAAASAEVAATSGGGGTIISSETAESIKTKLGITLLSGDNTGDESAASIKTKLGITTLSGANTGDESLESIKSKLGVTILAGDNTGDETASTIKTKLGVTTLSGSNTGDETSATIKSKLGVTTLSGSNTGDQTLASLGIPNVENKSSTDIRGELTSGNITTALGYTPPTQSVVDSKITNPMTSVGDVIVGGISGTPTRLPVGTNGQVWTVVANTPAWTTPTNSGASFFTSTAWVESSGNDTTGAVGNPSLPFATINAALDALSGSANACIRLGLGTFAPITDDYSTVTPSVPDAASKLRSNLTIIGTARPVLDSQTAPTQLINGSVIQGPLTFHSTRVNIELRNIGIDSGSVVCTALYGGADRSALEFFNIGQGAISPAHGIKVDNIICLTRTAAAVAHCALFENLIRPQIHNVQGYFGLHGVIFKTIGATISNIQSFGHSQDCIYFKDDSYARCYNNVGTNFVIGNLSGSDTPNGLFLTTGSTTPLELLTLSNVQCRGLSAYEIKADTISSGLNKNIRIDNIQSDNGAIRTSMANVTQSSFYINNAPVNGVVALTDGATINTDALVGSGVFTITPGAVGRTLANPTNLIIGQTYVWLITGGSGTITGYGTLFSFLPNATPTTSATAVVDVLTAIYDGTKLRAVYSKP